jgi:hypothetical protein
VNRRVSVNIEAAERAWNDVAPFHAEANGMSDRLLMTEIYVRLRLLERVIDDARTLRIENENMARSLLAVTAKYDAKLR